MISLVKKKTVQVCGAYPSIVRSNVHGSKTIELNDLLSAGRIFRFKDEELRITPSMINVSA
jgi:hypothetical protein